MPANDPSTWQLVSGNQPYQNLLQGKPVDPAWAIAVFGSVDAAKAWAQRGGSFGDQTQSTGTPGQLPGAGTQMLNEGLQQGWIPMDSPPYGSPAWNDWISSSATGDRSWNGYSWVPNNAKLPNPTPTPTPAPNPTPTPTNPTTTPTSGNWNFNNALNSGFNWSSMIWGPYYPQSSQQQQPGGSGQLPSYQSVFGSSPTNPQDRTPGVSLNSFLNPSQSRFVNYS